MMRSKSSPMEIVRIAATEGHLSLAKGRDLSTRLEVLFEAISFINEDEGFGSRLSEELCSDRVLKNSSKNIRLLASVNLVNLFRICAPTSPFSGAMLDAVFHLFIEQLNSITSHTGSSEAVKRFHILETLSAVKCPVLLLSSSDPVILRDFVAVLFKVVGRNVPKVIENAVFDTTVAICEEADNIPTSILDILFDHLLTADNNPSGFSLSKRIILHCASQMDTAISDFVNALVNNKPNQYNGAIRNRSQSLHILHSIAILDASLLHCVTPKLQDALDIENEAERLLFVKAFGRIFAKSGASAAKAFSQLIAAFLKRGNDISAVIRLEIVKSAAKMLETVPDIRSQVTITLRERVLDPDETVRCGTIEAVCAVALERPEIIESGLLRDIGLRMSDKKATVRKVSMYGMADLFSKHCARYWSEAKPVPTHSKKFSSIPHQIIASFGLDLPDKGAVAQDVFDQHLMNKHSSVKERSQLFLAILTTCDERNFRLVLSRYIHQQAQAQSKMSDIMQLHIQVLNGDSNAAVKLQLRIESLLTMLPIGHTIEVFQEMLQLDMKKHFKLLGVLCEPLSSYTDIRVAVKDFSHILGAPSKTHDRKKIYNLGVNIASRISGTVIGTDNVPEFILLIETHMHERGNPKIMQCGLKVLEEIALHSPQTIRCHLSMLTALIDVDEDKIKISVVEAVLSIISQCINENCIESLISRVCFFRKFCMNGSASIAQLAAKIVLQLAVKDNVFLDTLANECVAELHLRNDMLLPHLATLGELCHFAPKTFDSYREKVIKFVRNQVLMTDIDPTMTMKTSNRVKSNKMKSVTHLTLIKKVSIELLVKYVLSLDTSNDGISAAAPIMKLLLSIVNTNGDINNKGKLLDVDRSHILCSTIIAVLKLLTRPAFEAIIKPADFVKLSLLAQSDDATVRNTLLQTLWDHLVRMKLPFRYAIIFCLVATNNERDGVVSLKKQLSILVERQRKLCLMQAQITVTINRMPEFALAFLVHVLSHHPSLNNSESTYRQFSKYLSFFFDAILRQSHHNYSLLLAILVRIRSSEDTTDKLNAGIYALAELAQLLLKRRYQNQQWTVDVDSKFSLPSAWYSPLGKAITQKFLPDNFDLNLGKKPPILAISPKINTPKRTPQRRRPVSCSASAGSSVRSRRMIPRRAKNVPTAIDFSSGDEDDLQDDDDDDDDDDEDLIEDPLAPRITSENKPSKNYEEKQYHEVVSTPPTLSSKNADSDDKSDKMVSSIPDIQVSAEHDDDCKSVEDETLSSHHQHSSTTENSPLQASKTQLSFEEMQADDTHCSPIDNISTPLDTIELNVKKDSSPHVKKLFSRASPSTSSVRGENRCDVEDTEEDAVAFMMREKNSMSLSDGNARNKENVVVIANNKRVSMKDTFRRKRLRRR